MKVKLAFGKNGLDVDFPDELNVEIAKPQKQEPLQDLKGEINRAINNPIAGPQLLDIIKEKRGSDDNCKINTCIVVSDHTRPVPSHAILTPLLYRLKEMGIQSEDITILVGTGLHRASRDDELIQMLGVDIGKNYKIIIHDANDKDSLKYMGESSRNTPIWINKHYIDASLKILTGYVDPHFFAGFAGGRKAIVPGISGAETIIENHSARNINHPRARFLMLKDNPIHEDSLEISKMIGVDFIVNVCLNEDHEVIKVAAGNLEGTHSHLADYMKGITSKSYSSYFDIVVVNNGGYPLDLNLYQSVKSMIIGESAVKKSGTIIATNELSDGFGSEKFKEIIENEADPGALIERLIKKEMVMESQWQVQTLARVLLRAEVLVVSSLPESDFSQVKLGLKWVENFNKAMEMSLKKHGKEANILVLPAGPQLIPIIDN
ncbi:MAG: nickel-dependent lactate racemase [Candidatus Hodarchaeota archaeon]